MMRLFLVGLVTLSVVVRAAAHLSDTQEWNLFKTEHNKQYTSEVEEKFRKMIFLENRDKVHHHNQLHAQNLTSFTLKLNHMADMMSQEIVSPMTDYSTSEDETLEEEKENQIVMKIGQMTIDEENIINLEKENENKVRGASYLPPGDDVLLPSSVDWRKKGAVTAVESQGQCASGWAFSATGALEGQHYRRWARLLNISEQNLLDCCHLCSGCYSGRMDYAFTCIMQSGGIDAEIYYPYRGMTDVCRYNPGASVAQVTGYMNIAAGSEEALKAAVATVGPISAAMDASLSSFHYYTKGVYYDPQCSPSRLTHGVLVVGYGSNWPWGPDYWIIKNSWSTSWGEGGYMKLARNRNNHCGIASAAVYPLV